MDAETLARIQFAFTIGYHFIFVPISIGVGLMVVLFERRHYRSAIPADRAASDFWIKLFTATFAIGVATGITMEFAFGTNWAGYSRFVGNIFGSSFGGGSGGSTGSQIGFRIPGQAGFY